MESDAGRHAGDDSARTMVMLADEPDEVVHGSRGPELRPGDRVGRYRLVRRLGAGGMGVVWFARDPRLGRTVAVKVLHEQRRRSSAMARDRLRREAMALARLSHPNVVSIYDVGIHQRRVFLTMEHIEGRTLDVWAADAPSLSQVLSVFEQAAAGLAAVHQAGFVHRDFKPANVMIDRQGRVLVMDFGLARICDPDSVSEREVTTSSSAWALETTRLLSTSLTLDGTVMGTPAYMAPEQHLGDEADASSDQFSFCAALYETLTGRRPYAGRSIEELAREKRDARIDFRGGRLHLPLRLRALLRRGLHPDPSRRYASMKVLGERLARLLRPNRRLRWALASAGVVAVSGASWAGMVAPAHRACEAGAQHMAQVWNDDARARLHQAFDATEVSYARDAAHRTTARLDDYAHAWADGHRRACQASAHDVAALDLRMDCLSRARASMAATVGLLVEADTTTVQHAVAQVSGLPPLPRCDDVAALGAEVPPPVDAQVAATVDALSDQLESAHALERAGHYASGHDLAAEVLAEAEALDHEPTVVRARIRLAALELGLGEPESAREGLQDAALSAASIGDHRSAADAATRLVYVYSEALGRPDEAMPWARHAAASLGRAPADPLAQARLDSNLAIALSSQAHYDEALERFERAYEVKRAILGEQHPEVAGALENVAIAHGELGRPGQAEQLQRRSVVMLEQLLGSSHPDFGLSLMNLGHAVDVLGRHDEAAEHYTRALGIFRAALGQRHPMVARTLAALGTVASAQDRLHEAEAYYRQASEIMAATVGERHREYAWTLLDRAIVTSQLSREEEALGLYARAREIIEAAAEDHDSLAYVRMSESVSLVALGRYDEAERTLARAREIIDARLAPGHPAYGTWHADRGELLRARGDLQGARGQFVAALEIASAALGPEHPETAAVLQSLGEVEHALGQLASARSHLRRALEILEAGSVGEAFRSSVRFSLAKALAEDSANRAEAMALARRARAGFAGYGDTFDDDLAEIDAWRAQYARGR